jgi:hypothetical protein
MVRKSSRPEETFARESAAIVAEMKRMRALRGASKEEEREKLRVRIRELRNGLQTLMVRCRRLRDEIKRLEAQKKALDNHT